MNHPVLMINHGMNATLIETKRRYICFSKNNQHAQQESRKSTERSD
jgi:hypothetical protein